MMPSSSADDTITRGCFRGRWKVRVNAFELSTWTKFSSKVGSFYTLTPPRKLCRNNMNGITLKMRPVRTHLPFISSRNKLKAKYGSVVIRNFLALSLINNKVYLLLFVVCSLDALFESNRNFLHGKQSWVYCFFCYKPLRVERVLVLHLFSSVFSFCFSFSGKNNYINLVKTPKTDIIINIIWTWFYGNTRRCAYIPITCIMEYAHVIWNLYIETCQ